MTVMTVSLPSWCLRRDAGATQQQVSARPHPSLTCHMTFGDKHVGRVCFDLRYHPVSRLTMKLFKELQHFFFFLLKKFENKGGGSRDGFPVFIS